MKDKIYSLSSVKIKQISEPYEQCKCIWLVIYLPLICPFSHTNLLFLSFLYLSLSNSQIPQYFPFSFSFTKLHFKKSRPHPKTKVETKIGRKCLSKVKIYLFIESLPWMYEQPLLKESPPSLFLATFHLDLKVKIMHAHTHICIHELLDLVKWYWQVIFSFS